MQVRGIWENIMLSDLGVKAVSITFKIFFWGMGYSEIMPEYSKKCRLYLVLHKLSGYPCGVSGYCFSNKNMH